MQVSELLEVESPCLDLPIENAELGLVEYVYTKGVRFEYYGGELCLPMTSFLAFRSMSVSILMRCSLLLNSLKSMLMLTVGGK